MTPSITLETSQIDWAQYQPSAAPALKPKKQLRPHQTSAKGKVTKGFETEDRGKLIMACGTGKTFTSLKIAEEVAGKNKRVLFLVPSLNLLSQTLTEWTQESAIPLHSFAVCSDAEVGKKRSKDDDIVETYAHELRYPATTDAKRLAHEMKQRHDAGHMSVVFSTYHSIKVIADAQHLITKPVFDALFEDYSFASHNPVSMAMQQVLEILHEHHLEKEADTLEKFYASVKLRAASIDDVSAKQKIVVELYDKFFRNAFPKMTERLGIVYTPVEVVDFIIHSIDDLLRQEFGQTLGSKGVHIIDPFTGTGTFITRLLQSGLISKEQLPHKYNHEIHANEIVLLAYYIAAINIEAVYHSIMRAPELGSPLQGSDSSHPSTQGDALGYPIMPLWGEDGSDSAAHGTGSSAYGTGSSAHGTGSSAPTGQKTIT